jgi:CheY-like chemotaxis protein
VERILVVDDDRSTRHLIRLQLQSAGYAVETAVDGASALARIGRKAFDLVLLDVWMPGMDGLEVMARLREKDSPPGLISEVLASGPERPIEVISAKPDWVELVVPCDRQAAARIQSVLAQLETDLPEDVRTNVGQAFRELLMNAIEWGGELDPNRTVRIAYLRARRMLLYRIADPGRGFDFTKLNHAAVSNPSDRPMEHAAVREEMGLRPGGFGLVLTRAMVDELLFNEAQNEVVFVKYLD